MLNNDEIKKIIDYDLEEYVIDNIRERLVNELDSIVIMIAADVICELYKKEYKEFLKKHDNHFGGTEC
jgi:protein-tyrosine-phosphatase